MSEKLVPKKRRTLDFEEWYTIAKAYYEEHGDLLVPRSYEDAKGHKLGRWIERLRAFYNGSSKVKVTLTTTGIQMLNDIGMVWKLEDRFGWSEWMLQCRLYYAANGDLLVPTDYKNDKYALGNWIKERRKDYRKGKLSDDKIEELEQYGMVWEAKGKELWEKRYNDAYKYYKDHGNLNVPPSMQTVGDIGLREWIMVQKSIYQESNCTTDLAWNRHDLLDDIGINWEKTNGRAVFSCMSLAKTYYEEYGDLNVPDNYKDLFGVDLLGWVKRQWRLYHRPATGKSRPYRAKKKALEAVGFDWSCDGRWDWDPKELAWLNNYNEIKGYTEKNQKLPVGVSDITLSSGISADNWISAQRVAIKNGFINEDKHKMLSDIGIQYGQQKEK